MAAQEQSATMRVSAGVSFPILAISFKSRPKKKGTSALDDFLVYAYYGHKREHSAQIAAFRDRQDRLQ